MRIRTLFSTVAVLVTVVALAAPAAAGGWWSGVHLDDTTLHPGETVHLTSEAWWETTEMAEAAMGTQFYAYLVTDYDEALLSRAMGKPSPNRWWAAGDPEGLTRLGRVRIVMLEGNLGKAKTTVTIPDVPFGDYSLMLCDEGCVNPLGSVVPTDVTVTSAAAAAAAAAREARLSSDRVADRVAALRREARRFRQDALRAQDEAEALQSSMEHTQLALRGMQLRLEQLMARPAERPGLEPFGAGMGVGLGLAALVVALWRRRRPSVSGPPPDAPPGDSLEPKVLADGRGEWERPLTSTRG